MLSWRVIGGCPGTLRCSATDGTLDEIEVVWSAREPWLTLLDIRGVVSVPIAVVTVRNMRVRTADSEAEWVEWWGRYILEY